MSENLINRLSTSGPVSVNDVTRLMAKHKTIDQVPTGWPQSTKGLMPPEEPLQDPWVDPVTALSAGFGGALPRALGRVGTEGIKALAGPVVSGLASGLMDYPVGTLTEMVGQKYPKAALPANIALGLASGMTFERLAEEAMEDPRAAINYAKGLLADDAGYITFHGTPHQWAPEPGFPHGRPRLDKIGAGEGAQAYGHGWYSADESLVARQYKRPAHPDLVGLEIDGVPVNSMPENTSYDFYTAIRAAERQGGIDEAIKHYSQEALETRGVNKNYSDGMQEIADVLKAYEGKNLKRVYSEYSGRDVPGHFGNIYKLDIPDDISDKLLDWDKPLSEQSEYVKKAIEKITEDKELVDSLKKDRGTRDFLKGLLGTSEDEFQKKYTDLGYTFKNGEMYDTSGNKIEKSIVDSQRKLDESDQVYMDMGHMYRDLAHMLGSDVSASKVLRNAGIPGNKYLDGVSRGQGKGSYNYVIWDQPTLDRVKVLQRNNETLDPIGNSIAELNQADPTHKLKFDGIQEGFGTIPSKYQVTPQDGPAKGATFLVDDPTQESIAKRLAEMIDMRNSDASNFVKVYRGEYQGNKGGKYWTPDVEFSRNFTQSGRDDEIFQSFVNKKDIYIPESPVYAGDPDAIKSEISKARRKGLKAIELDEGEGQPKSIYVFDDKALKSKKKYEN